MPQGYYGMREYSSYYAFNTQKIVKIQKGFSNHLCTLTTLGELCLENLDWDNEIAKKIAKKVQPLAKRRICLFLKSITQLLFKVALCYCEWKEAFVDLSSTTKVQ